MRQSNVCLTKLRYERLMQTYVFSLPQLFFAFSYHVNLTTEIIDRPCVLCNFSLLKKLARKRNYTRCLHIGDVVGIE
jgi:hypothetical protein